MGKSFVILYIGNSSKIYKVNVAILKGIPLQKVLVGFLEALTYPLLT